MPPMTSYHLDSDVRGELHHAVHGRVAFEFEAGDVDPRSEQDEVALEHLVSIGRATSQARPAPKRRRKKVDSDDETAAAERELADEHDDTQEVDE